MVNSTILITGSNRGLGRGMLTNFLRRPNTTAIAAVRDPSHPSALSLASLPKGDGSQLIIVKLDSADANSVSAAVQSLQTEHGITALDLVVANAAISGVYPTVASADPAAMLDMYRINTIGSVLAYQATRSLLHASAAARGGVFVAVSTAAAWQTRMVDVPVPNAVYGPSKTALNWLMQKAHIEDEKLVVFPLDPGFVQTDMGNDAARQFDLPDGLAPLTIEESVKGCLAVVSPPAAVGAATQLTNAADGQGNKGRNGWEEYGLGRYSVAVVAESWTEIKKVMPTLADTGHRRYIASASLQHFLAPAGPTVLLCCLLSQQL